MSERNFEARINERLFPKDVLTRKFVVPFNEYLATIFDCNLNTTRLAEGIIRSLVPLCEVMPASEFELDSVTLPDGHLFVRDLIEKTRKGHVVFGFNRGSAPLIYLLGQPELVDSIPKIWEAYMDSPTFDQDDLITQKTISKIAPLRDLDIVLRNRFDYDNKDIVAALEVGALGVYERIGLDEVPPEVKATSNRYWSPSARVYRNGDSFVLIGESQRAIQKGEPRNTMVDIYQNGSLALRLDINSIDPHSSLPNNYRMGINRPLIDHNRADLDINEAGEIKVLIHPLLLQYFSEARPFTQFGTHTHFTHALTGLLKEIETVIFYAGNFSPNINIFDVIKYWVLENSRSDYQGFYLWSLILGRGRLPDQQLIVAEKERTVLLQRQSEITASYIRGMTRNPFLFLAIASGLHLMTHVSRGPEHFAHYFIPEIIYMAQQIAPEVNWVEEIVTLDDLWSALPRLTHYYEERVLKNPLVKLVETGAFLFADALNRNPVRIFRYIQLTPKGVVSLYSPFDEKGEPRHLFFPTP